MSAGAAATGAVADAIVVAAGMSRRMAGVDKLAWTIAGRPLLAYALDGLAAAPEISAIVVVTSAERHADLASAPWLPAKVARVVVGGDRRQDSVAAGFAALDEIAPDPAGTRIALVHDGARPVVTPDLVAAVVAATRTHGAAIPIVPVVETVKRIDGDVVAGTVDRATLGAAQTPQGVLRGVWRSAVGRPEARGGTWTDEAALLEACRIPVHIVPGDPANLKVTMPADLPRAAAVLDPLSDRTVRYGIGHDAHPFGPGAPLVLGGVVFEGTPRLSGHSDGDVTLHAVADALLGAAGLGDLGRLFPAGPATPVGIDSREMLATVVDRLEAAGWRPSGIDLTIVAARPRLGSHLDAIREAIAGIVGLETERVNVKASTGNLDGSEGAGRTISTLAIASVEARG